MAMEDRHPRRDNPARRRRPLQPSGLETLESRELMAYSALGYSLPDLSIRNAFSGPIAAYGGEVAVTVDVANLGASSLAEPLNLAPGATSTADAPASVVNVYLVRNPRLNPERGIFIGTVNVPAIPQNRLARVTATINLPANRPAGYPDSGQNVFLAYKIDAGRQVQDFDRTNNVFRSKTPILLTPNLPQLETVAFEVPANLSPGDAFFPELKVANYGAAPTDVQAPVLVQVVASIDQDFGPGDQLLASFSVANIEPYALAPTQRAIIGDVNLIDPPNFVSLTTTDAVTLPTLPSEYFIGVIVDPFDQIREIDELAAEASPRLEQVKLVRPSGVDLPAAGVVGSPSTTVFPYFPYNGSATATPIAFSSTEAPATTVLSADTTPTNRPGAGRDRFLSAALARRAQRRAFGRG
jgi:hypothetical protein